MKNSSQGPTGDSQNVLSLPRGQGEAISKKKSAYKIEENLSFKTINKNLDELQEAMTQYEK